MSDCRRCGLALPLDAYPSAIYHGGLEHCYEYVFARLNACEMERDLLRGELWRLREFVAGLTP